LPEFEPLPFPARIGLLADTHLTHPARGLPSAVLDAMATCDVVFHAGDVNRLWVLEALGRCAPVHAVYGNNDAVELLRSLPFERFFQSGPYRIGLIHGHADHAVRRVTARVFAEERMRGVVDCVVYGHSHRPEVAERGGMLMVNPGSPTQPRWAPSATYGLLEVSDTMRAKLVHVWPLTGSHGNHQRADDVETSCR
jgi:putative phosphoesterase